MPLKVEVHLLGFIYEQDYVFTQSVRKAGFVVAVRSCTREIAKYILALSDSLKYLIWNFTRKRKGVSLKFHFRNCRLTPLLHFYLF